MYIYTYNKHDVYNHTDTQNLTPNKFANILRFGATIFKLLVEETTSFELVLREIGANPKHCCWVEISRAMDSRDLIIFSVAAER